MQLTKHTQRIHRGTPPQVSPQSPAATRLSFRTGSLTSRRGKGNTFVLVDPVELIPKLRYINTDYAVASALVNNTEAGITDVVVTYDIVRATLPPSMLFADRALLRRGYSISDL